MRLLALAAICCLTVGSAHAQGELLQPCESLDGVSLGMGNNYDESKLFLSHAAEHVTEGVAAIGAVTRSAEDAKGNVYLSINLPIEPTDFTGRALAFDVASSTPERSQAFYVRAYDEFGSMVMSWQSWSGELTAEAQQFVLTPGTDAHGLAWEPNRVQTDDLSAVTRLEFITGTGEKGVYFNVTVDNVRAVPAP